MTNRVFLTDRLFKKCGDWLGQGLAEALFHVWCKGDVFEIEPDVILLAEGQSAQFIRKLPVPKIFISRRWEVDADDCVPADLDFIIAAIRAQIQTYQQQETLNYYTHRAHHNGLLEPTFISNDPANLLVMAGEEDRAILEIQLHDYHRVYDYDSLQTQMKSESEFEGIIVKDDLEKLTTLAAKPETQGLPLFFWSESRSKQLVALRAGFDYIPHLSQAEPRITNRIWQRRRLALHHSQLNSTLEMAARDSLTGLYNYRCFTTHLPALLKNISVSNRSLAAISFDLDHFKQINDHWGHSTGDGILQKVAELLQQELRLGDTLYRMGGDEFLALIQNVETKEDSYRLAERLCQVVSETYFVAGEEVVPLTMSAGVSFYEKEEEGASLLHRADEALYSAKNAGRNRAA